ncbi:MAG: hypothetical protein RBT20_01780 [Syntrophales bacterium]|nr:hypothetical protein [Syntrophales bacterium]
MAIDKSEKINLLCETRHALLIAAEFIAGNSPFTKEAVLRELDDAGVMITTVILSEKPGKADGKPDD